MSFLFVLLTIYVLSVLGAAAINWSDYRDRKTYFDGRRKDKVVKLYIVPMCPIVNTMIIAGEIFNYVG